MRLPHCALLLFIAAAFPFDAAAERPPPMPCTLTKAQRTKALAQVRKTYPQVKRVAKEDACLCRLYDCAQVDVLFDPVTIKAPQSNVTFNLQVRMEIWLEEAPMLIIEGEPQPFDFDKAAATISELPVRKLLFGDDPIVCDGREQYGSLDFACGKKEPRTALNGGRPAYGAHLFTLNYHRTGSPTVGTIAGPAKLMQNLNDMRWRRFSREEEVAKFLKEHPDSTITLTRTAEIHAPPQTTDDAEIRTVLSLTGGKARIQESRLPRR